MKRIVIHPTGEFAIIDEKGRTPTEDFDWVLEQIGGWAEAVDLKYGCFGYVDEEGLMKRKPMNITATHLRLYQGALPLVGTMIVYGKVDRAGNPTEVTKEMEEFLVSLPK